MIIIIIMINIMITIIRQSESVCASTNTQATVSPTLSQLGHRLAQVIVIINTIIFSFIIVIVIIVIDIKIIFVIIIIATIFSILMHSVAFLCETSLRASDGSEA